ncbi:hypothetical protein BH23ACT5_BH23ACT5_11000 [soil metagenome]
MALLEYTELLTRSPAAVTARETETLRAAGWDDRAITDATQVCAYFNYINRIAEGLGVDAESWIDEGGRPQASSGCDGGVQVRRSTTHMIPSTRRHPR